MRILLLSVLGFFGLLLIPREPLQVFGGQG